MTTPIEQLKHYNMRLTTVLNELGVLEDFKSDNCTEIDEGDCRVDYSDIVTDIGYCTVLLEQRRERLQRRGRTQ